jgi:hypothetical protein
MLSPVILVPLNESHEPSMASFVGLARHLSQSVIKILCPQRVNFKQLAIQHPQPGRATEELVIAVRSCIPVGAAYEITGLFVRRSLSKLAS